MSTVKKLSLSGFKSTFKRKSSKGSARNNVETITEQRRGQQQGYVCDIESSKTNDEYENMPSKNGPVNMQSMEIISRNHEKDGLKPREMKTSRWGFRQKAAGKDKICENGNEKVGTIDLHDHDDCEPGSGICTDGGPDAAASDLPLCEPPSANGHIVVDNPNTNDNECGYLGARLSKTPCISSFHSFQDVDNSNHVYINDGKSKKNEMTETAHCANECGIGNLESDKHRRYNVPLPVPNHEVHNMNLKCDVNDNAEMFEDKLDECLENNVTCLKVEDCITSEDIPPAIPPKPASLYSNGQWVLRGSESVESKNKKNSTMSLSEEQDVPPRPPARSKTRCGVDVNLPFYKQYLEMKEKSSPAAPIYEDVRVEVGLESGGLAGELSKLPRQPWYWGPMSQDDAEEKLKDAVDGSFLVRDSSDDRYLLTLSFKSNGRTLHTRIEHRNGFFSLNDSEGHASVIELVENAVKESQGGVFGYMNDSSGIQNFPARLTQWVSRYSEVKSLQYLCRFVIRETYPRHHIRHLPLPKKINEYILENQY